VRINAVTPACQYVCTRKHARLAAAGVQDPQDEYAANAHVRAHPDPTWVFSTPMQYVHMRRPGEHGVTHTARALLARTGPYSLIIV
jgi:hypothetical protein